MNGQTQKLIWWLLGALLVVTLGLSSALFGLILADINRVERGQAIIQKDIKGIQAEYYRIAVMEERMRQILDILKGEP